MATNTVYPGSLVSIDGQVGRAAFEPQVAICSTILLVILTADPGPTDVPSVTIGGHELTVGGACSFSDCDGQTCHCTLQATVPCDLPTGAAQAVFVHYAALVAPVGRWASDNSAACVKVIDNGNVSGDPHFIGLDGQRYKVAGQAGFYNLISMPDFQMNAYWVSTRSWDEDYVVTAELGIRYKYDTIFLSRTARVRLNDIQVPRSDTPLQFADGEASIQRDLHSSPAEGGPLILTPELLVKVIMRGYELDVKAVELLVAPSADIHGLLGQSWNSTHWPATEKEITDQAMLFGTLLDGELQDYTVKDGLFGSDFAFNRFRTDLYGAATAIAPPVSEYWLNEEKY